MRICTQVEAKGGRERERGRGWVGDASTSKIYYQDMSQEKKDTRAYGITAR